MREATQRAGAKVEEPILRSTASWAPAVHRVPFPRLLPGGHTGDIWPLRCLGPRVFLKTREHELHGPSRGVQEKSRYPPPLPAAPVLTAVTLPHLPLKQVRAGGRTHRTRA